MSLHTLFCRTLASFNLVDRQCNLSITNIAVIVLITKIALAPTLDWATAGTLMMALLNYGHKRHESNKAEKDLNTVSDFKEVKDQLSTVSAQVKEFQEGFEAVARQSEETKKALSNANLMSAFKPRGQQ